MNPEDEPTGNIFLDKPAALLRLCPDVASTDACPGSRCGLAGSLAGQDERHQLNRPSAPDVGRGRGEGQTSEVYMVSCSTRYISWSGL